jgi:Uncharacterized protein conserved in bacteria (DUF2188)
MLGRHIYRVSQSSEGWVVRKDGDPESRGERSTREDAIDLACSLAERDEPSRVNVENPDGTLSEERAFGVDRGQTVKE